MRTALLVTLFAAGISSAGTIVITETATGSGTLGSSTYTNSLVTLTFTGDTINSIANGPFYSNSPGTITITIASLAETVSLTDIGAAYSGPTSSNPAYGAGLSDGTLGGYTILGTASGAFSNYALTTSIGPVTGPGEGNPPGLFPTTGGSFGISSWSNTTFTATVTPEPGPAALIALGIATLAAIRLRR